MKSQAINPKAYAKLLARKERMDRAGFPVFVSRMAAIMLLWMSFCFALFSWISGNWRALLRERWALWPMFACLLFSSVIFALFQWYFTHMMARKAAPESRA